jgi:hypothetical protein
MALVLPVLLLVVVGIIEFGFVFNAQISLTQSVREGVRVGAIGPSPTESLMRDAMRDAYFGVTGDKPEMVEDESHACGDGVSEAQLTGVLAYQAPVTRFGPFDLEATAVMRCGG